MVNYEKLYYRLFNVLTDAINAIEEEHYTAAAEMLKKAQIDAEELYIEDDPG